MSDRDITAPNIAGLSAKLVRPIVFVRLDFVSGVQRFHTEIGPRTATHPIYGAEVYSGIGDFGGITADVVESVSNAPQPIKLGLSGINSTLLASGLDPDDYFWRDVDMLFGMDDDTGTLLDDPVLLDSRYMDKVQISMLERKVEMTLICESRAAILRGSSDLRFTDEQLQADFPGDLAGEYFYRMLDIVLRWGGEVVQAAGGAGGGARPNIRIR